MERVDNVDGLDLNSGTGTVVTDKDAQFATRLDLAGTSSKPIFQALRGQMSPGKLEATLLGDKHSAKILFREDEQQAHYRLELQDGPTFSPGALDVTENKLTGELTVRQQNDFPWTNRLDPAYPTRELRFSPQGPEDGAGAEFYRQGRELENSVREEIAQVRQLDNTSKDLNPEDGLMILAGHGYIASEDLHGRKGPTVPSEVSLKLEQGTGRVEDYSRGFGEHKTVLYRREGETEIFQRQEKGYYLRLEIHPDGTRFQQQLAQADFTDLNPEMLKQEATVSNALLPRMFNAGNLLMVGFAACAAAFNFVAVGLVGHSLGAAHPALFGALAASLAAVPLAVGDEVLSLSDLKVINGVNRFAGSSPQEQMNQARQAIRNYPARLEVPGGATREDCLQFLSSTNSHTDFGDNRSSHRLAVLVDSYGQSKEPALLVIPEKHGFPVQAQPEGLRLFDGSVIPYGAIRGLAEIMPPVSTYIGGP